MIRPSRRQFLGYSALLPLAAAGCTTNPPPPDAQLVGYAGGRPPTRPGGPNFPPYAQMYSAVSDGGHNIPAIPYQEIDDRLLRQVVRNPTGEPEGTIVVETRSHYLYLVIGGGNAIRYGVGLGREGFEWSGRAEVGSKQRWPRWFPPDEMIDREPHLEPYRASDVDGDNIWEGGMDPGIMNPLGARALYIYEDGKDTLYRLHGNPQWTSIGRSVSSGCVRLMNQDVIDLYDRVSIGAPILVR